MKKCRFCKKEKDITEFDGFSFCIKCDKRINKEHYRKIRDLSKMKICYECGCKKDLVEFSKDSTRFDGLSNKCKSCKSNHNKEYYKEVENKGYYKTKKGRFSSYKSGSKSRGIDFNLTEDEFFSFWQKDCYYCGSKIDTVGIDRIDSSIGYNINNCRSCCFICNTMKSSLKESDFLNHIQKVLNNINK